MRRDITVPSHGWEKVSIFFLNMELLHRRPSITRLSPQKLEDDDIKASRRLPPPPRGITIIVSIFIFFSIVAFWVLYLHAWLPPPRPRTIPNTEFSEERAREVLSNLMEFGTRTVGSVANEVHTPNMLLSRVCILSPRIISTCLSFASRSLHSRPSPLTTSGSRLTYRDPQVPLA
jgi:hypothetical protein